MKYLYILLFKEKYIIEYLKFIIYKKLIKYYRLLKELLVIEINSLYLTIGKY